MEPEYHSTNGYFRHPINESKSSEHTNPSFRLNFPYSTFEKLTLTSNNKYRPSFPFPGSEVPHTSYCGANSNTLLTRFIHQPSPPFFFPVVSVYLGGQHDPIFSFNFSETHPEIHDYHEEQRSWAARAITGRGHSERTREVVSIPVPVPERIQA